MHELLTRLEAVAPREGRSATAIPFLSVNRRSRASLPHAHVLTRTVALLLAGHKRVRSGTHDRDLRKGDTIVVPHAVPIISQVLRAPYLCVLLDIDLEVVGSLATCAPAASSDIRDPLLRLARLLESPAEIPVIAPLLQRELFYRLLSGPNGPPLREMAKGHDGAIAAARAWLDSHFADTFEAHRLAERFHLSVSALYARFRASTGVTPLRYQKQRRLEAARRLLFAEDLDVRAIAYRVGYASASQFSRDYRRAFATSPRRDRDALRQPRSPVEAEFGPK
jgi:AraC-like DNA-binding protein